MVTEHLPNKTILLGCYEVPGWGGASTSSYKLFELMRNDGIDVTFLNIIAENDADYFRYLFGEQIGNPKKLDGVHNCFLGGDTFRLQPELEKLIDKIDPDIIVGIGWIASVLMKRETPDRKLIYVTTGCDQVSRYIKRKEWDDFILLNNYLTISGNHLGSTSDMEKETVKTADLIIAHSDMVLLLYRHFFDSQTGKISPQVIWFADWIYKDALDYASLQRPFHNREIDIVFIASSWSRPEKNYKLAREIISGLKGLNIHILGEVEEKDSRATYHNLITNREELFSLLGNSKTIVSPSLFDAAPGVLFEAAAMRCNVIASKNCGNWMLCNYELLVDPFTLDTFLDKIHRSLNKKYEDNISYFLQTNSYKNLVETILLF